MPSTTTPAPPRVQPPPPKISPPSATSYRTQRQEELDAVRRRGLAKIFNKHFTTVADKIRQEHEAAELALAEIVKRKAELAANPKSFDGAGGLTLTQLDKLHMEIMKRKKDVQRKERETQELYKRYCSQYEDNEHVARHIRLQEGQGDDISLVRQTDLILAKSLDKGQATQNSDVHKLANLLEEGANLNDDDLGEIGTPDKIWSRSLPNSNSTEDDDDAGPNSADKNHLAKKLSFTPDAVAPTADITPNKKLISHTSPAPTEMSTPQSDTAAKTPTSKKGAPGTLRVTALGCDSSVMDQSLYMNADDESEVSGLTDIDGATVAEAEWRLTEFLRNETENIKKMFTADGDEEEDSDVELASYSQSVFSHLGGLTFVSGESDRVGRAAKKAEDMVKEMAEATAWMNDPTLLDSDSDSDSGESETKPKPDWCAFWSADHDREYYFNRFTNQTCWTKPQDVEIDFSQTKSFKSDDCSVTSTGTSNISIVLSNPGVDDEKVTVRDYTKPPKGTSATSTSSSSYSNDDPVDVYRPDTSSATDGSVNSRGSVNKPSKVLQYRRRRAQQRRKKRLICGLVLSSAIGAIVYTKRDSIFPKAENRDIPPVAEIAIPASPTRSDFDLTSAAKKLDEVRKAKEVEQKKLVLEAAKKAKSIAVKKKEEEQKNLEQKKKDEELKKKAELEDSKKKKDEELKRKEAEKKAEEEHMRQKEAERKKQEEERIRLMDDKKKQELALREEEVRRKQFEQELALFEEEMRRPWGCNIPLTYLMSKKCWRVASKNPIYDCEAITDCMIE